MYRRVEGPIQNGMMVRLRQNDGRLTRIVWDDMALSPGLPNGVGIVRNYREDSSPDYAFVGTVGPVHRDATRYSHLWYFEEYLPVQDYVQDQEADEDGDLL